MLQIKGSNWKTSGGNSNRACWPHAEKKITPNTLHRRRRRCCCCRCCRLPSGFDMESGWSSCSRTCLNANTSHSTNKQTKQKQSKTKKEKPVPLRRKQPVEGSRALTRCKRLSLVRSQNIQSETPTAQFWDGQRVFASGRRFSTGGLRPESGSWSRFDWVTTSWAVLFKIEKKKGF